MRNGRWRSCMEIGAVKSGEARNSKQPKAAPSFILQKLEETYHACLAAGCQRKALHAANANEIGPRRDRLDDVAAAADRSIHQNFSAARNRVHDLRQHIHRAAAVIELPSAVIGDIDPIDPMIERNPGVLGRGYALDRERDVETVLEPLDRLTSRAPLEMPGLARAAGRR